MLVGVTRPPASRFTVNLTAQTVPSAYRNSEYWVWLTDMKRFFEQIIVGVTSLPGQAVSLNVDVSFVQLAAGTLAQCGPGNGDWTTMNIATLDAFLLDLRIDDPTQTATTKHCVMKFNTDYYKEPPISETDRGWKRQFFTTAVHECFHGCGLGSIWNGPFKRLVNNVPIVGGNILLPDIFPINIIGTGNPTDPRYTKAGALNEYRAQMIGQSGAASIPIENVGMSSTTLLANAGGTALAHWRGSQTGTPSGIVNAQGQDWIDEVMVTWSNRNEGVNRWVGRFTLASLADMGWAVDYTPITLPLLSYKTA